MATSHAEGSGAAVAREDISLDNAQGMEAFMTGEGSVYTILRAACKMPFSGAGKFTLNFKSSDIYRQDASAANLAKVDGAPYRLKTAGTEYERDFNPAFHGMRVGLSRSDAATRNAMRNGSSWERLEAAKGLESFSLFVEEMELLGTEPAALGLGDATTPFVIADTDADASYGQWNVNTSNPAKEVRGRINALKEYGVIANFGLMSWTVLDALMAHPKLTAHFGGNVGFGDLTAAQVAAALGLQGIFAGNPDRYGEYVTICAQQPGSDFYSRPQNSNTVIYAYDPSEGSDEWGGQYSTESIGGTHGDDETVLYRAYCDVQVNPLAGCRISNVLS